MNKEIIEKYYSSLEGFQASISDCLSKIEDNEEGNNTRIYILNDLQFVIHALKNTVMEQLEDINQEMYKKISAPKKEAEK